jgi:hypothetical protein
MKFQNAKLELCRHDGILRCLPIDLSLAVPELVSVLQARFKHNVIQFARLLI